ncbi:MAG: hypothetical protein AB1603_01850 [Chloroflexota bacterium]
MDKNKRAAIIAAVSGYLQVEAEAAVGVPPLSFAPAVSPWRQAGRLRLMQQRSLSPARGRSGAGFALEAAAVRRSAS